MIFRRLRKGVVLSKSFAWWNSAALESSACRYSTSRLGEAPRPFPATTPVVTTEKSARLPLQLPPQPQQQHPRPFSTDAAFGTAIHNPNGGIGRRDQPRSTDKQSHGGSLAGERHPFGGTSLLPGDEEAGDRESLSPWGTDAEEDEEQEVIAVTRGRKERRDSVTESILKERERHLMRLAKSDVDQGMAKTFKGLSLGSRKRPRQAGGFNKAYDQTGKQVHSDFAAGGFARWMGSASKGWPTFKHQLPEVALAGHTNCGKSTLVNALSGIHPRRGPASTSDRAGWTDLVGFYQVGKKPPVLTLVDLPGYGHAVATKHAIKGWLRMIKEYITTRQELIRCCVLVDCTRGFCEEDRSLLKLLAKRNIPYQIVLTKADLLTPELLSACVLLLRRELSDLIGPEAGSIASFSAVCGSSGAGVTTLWKDLAKLASKAPGSLVAIQAAHLAARQAREKEDAVSAASSSREH